jgi:hypothetical protein
MIRGCNIIGVCGRLFDCSYAFTFLFVVSVSPVEVDNEVGFASSRRSDDDDACVALDSVYS